MTTQLHITNDLSAPEYNGFPPERNGLYFYREIRELPTHREIHESAILVVDGVLTMTGHARDGLSVDDLTVGPIAIGEWSFIRDIEPADCFYAAFGTQINPHADYKLIMIDDPIHPTPIRPETTQLSPSLDFLLD